MTKEEFYKQGNRICNCNSTFYIEKTEKKVNYGRGGMINRFLKTHTKIQVRFWVRCTICQKSYFVSDIKRKCKTILDILKKSHESKTDIPHSKAVSNRQDGAGSD